MINALNSGADVFMADFEDSLSPSWRNVVLGQQNCIDAVRRTISLESGGKSYRLNDKTAVLLVRPRGWHLPEKHVTVDGNADQRQPLRLRALLLPQRPRAARPRHRPLLLPAEDREPPRGAAVERGVRLRPGGAEDSAGQHPGHDADRDAPRGVRDGGVPLRAARARQRPQRRALGLHVLLHQEVPEPEGQDAPGSRAGDDDRPLHARLHRAAGQVLPHPRRARDGRHGALHPQPEESRDQREGAGQGPRRQAARGERRLRRHLGGAPRPGPHRQGGLRPEARGEGPPEGTAALRGPGRPPPS